MAHNCLFASVLGEFPSLGAACDLGKSTPTSRWNGNGGLKIIMEGLSHSLGQTGQASMDTCLLCSLPAIHKDKNTTIVEGTCSTLDVPQAESEQNRHKGKSTLALPFLTWLLQNVSSVPSWVAAWRGGPQEQWAMDKAGRSRGLGNRGSKVHLPGMCHKADHCLPWPARYTSCSKFFLPE